MCPEQVVVSSLSASECSVLKNRTVTLLAAWCFGVESLSGAGNLSASNGR